MDRDEPLEPKDEFEEFEEFEDEDFEEEEDDDLDPDELRYALWGEVDAGARRVALRIEAEGPEGPTAERVHLHRKMRDIMRRIEENKPPAHLMDWLRNKINEMHPPTAKSVRHTDGLDAVPMPQRSGMRGAADGKNTFTIAVGPWIVEVKSFPEDDNRAFAFAGRVLDVWKVAQAGVPVTLMVDNAERDTVETDEDGQFTFRTNHGMFFYLIVGRGGLGETIYLPDLPVNASPRLVN